MSRFKEIKSNSSYLEKPLLLSIASCYLCCPSIVETVLEKDEKGGFVIWASALSSLSSKAFSGDLSAESEIKLIAMTLAKVVEQLMDRGIPFTEWSQECFSSLVEACKRLKEVQREEEEAESDEEADDADEDSETDDYDDEEDSEEDVREETEEEFLERYAKTAAALENGTIVEEGDAEEDDEEPELGCLEEFDQQKLLESLLEKYHQVLIQRQLLSPQLMTSILNSFPEYERFFRQ